MPIYTIYPGPGKGLRTTGIDKDQGWGSRTPGGQVLAGRDGQQGINHTAGISTSGLDNAANPIITARAVTSITGTGATVTWTTAVGQPPGRVAWRLAGQNVAATVVNEGGAYPITNHSIAVTGFTSGKVYEYRVTQQSQTGGGIIEWDGRITAGVSLLAAGGTGGDGGGAQLSTSPSTSSPPPPAAPSQPRANAFPVTNVEVVDITGTEATVRWRTGVYADGTVVLRAAAGDRPVDEIGVKRMNHSVTLTGLTPGTHYEVNILSTDAQGEEARGGPVDFDTPAS